MKFKTAVMFVIVAVVMASLPSLVSAQGMEVTSAKVYYKQNNLDKMEAMLIQAMEKDPEHNEANFYFGVFYFHRGNYAQTMQHWDKITYKKLPKKAKNLHDRLIKNLFSSAAKKGAEAFSQKDWDNAVTSFRVAMKVNPNPKDQAVATNLGLALIMGEQTDEGIEVLEKVVEAEPTNLPAWNGLTVGYARKEDHPNVIKTYTKYIELADQPESSAYHQLARSYKAIGDTAKAIETYETAIDAIPDEIYFYLIASEFRALAGENEKAAEILERAHNVDPTNTDVLNHLGTVYYILKQFQKAVEPLEVYLQLEPNSIDGWETLGNAYYGLSYQARDQGDAAKQEECAVKGEECLAKSNELMRSGEGK